MNTKLQTWAFRIIACTAKLLNIIVTLPKMRTTNAICNAYVKTPHKPFVVRFGLNNEGF